MYLLPILGVVSCEVAVFITSFTYLQYSARRTAGLSGLLLFMSQQRPLCSAKIIFLTDNNKGAGLVAELKHSTFGLLGGFS